MSSWAPPPRNRRGSYAAWRAGRRFGFLRRPRVNEPVLALAANQLAHVGDVVRVFD
jgi:hypothetical protein